jgi:hypothetical protein
MKLVGLVPKIEEKSAAANISIFCIETGKQMPWNSAARAGWVADLDGPAYQAYYSPEGLALKQARDAEALLPK